jgi:hypothetical protein
MIENKQKNGTEKEKKRNIFHLPHLHCTSNPLMINKNIHDPGNIYDDFTEQKRHNHSLDDIPDELSELGRIEHDVALCIERDFSSIENAVRAAFNAHHMLELLQASCSILPDQLNAAFDEQKRTGEKLGEALVRLGFIDQQELDVALFAKYLMDEGKVPSWLRLGQLLILAGYITHEHLNDALERQQGSKKKLGEILVDAGHAQQHHVEHGLHLQKHLIEALLVAALSLLPMEEATSSSQSGSIALSTNIEVNARVLARASVHILQQPVEITITDADIQKGFIDVNTGSLVEIRNNTRAGVNITFEANGMTFKETIVNGLGKEVALGPNGGIVNCQITGTKIMALSYRFILDRNLQAGTYTWPLSLSVNPVE